MERLSMAEFKKETLVNKISVCGVVKESKLRKQDGIDKVTNQKYNYINGSLVIKCGETRELEVKVFVKELYTNREGVQMEASNYKNLINLVPNALGETVLPTMTKVSEEEATKVSVWGNAQLKDNYYVGKDGNIVEIIDFDLGYGKLTLKDNSLTVNDYYATFEVATFIYDVQPELDKEEQETGRAKVTTYVPTFGGKVIPLTIYAGMVVDEQGEFDFGRAILDGVQPQDTIIFYGDINFAKTTTKVKRGGEGTRSLTGREIYDTKTVTVREFVATNGQIVEDYEKAFQLEDIQEAVKQRKIAMEQKKMDEENKVKAEPKASARDFGRPSPLAGASTSTTRKAPLF